jgi:hypothetical protein
VKAMLPALAILSAAAPSQAAEPPAALPAEACLMLNNRVLGPRTESRPLPLLRGDAEHGFTTACSATWNAINPKNEPLPVEACFRGSLLQLPNDSACGAGTGKLWIGARWVITSADLAQGKVRAAVCQQLETGAWAGTRAFSLECKPRTRDLTGVKADNKPAHVAPSATQPAPPPAQKDRR